MADGDWRDHERSAMTDSKGSPIILRAPGPGWTLKSDIWIRVSNYPADPWMNELWFDPDNTASNGLPPC